MRNRLEEIHSKGFSISPPRDTNMIQPGGYQGPPALDFNKIKVGAKVLDDAIIKLGDLKAINPQLADKCMILRAIDTYDLPKMREISNFFYKTSGIYARILRYMAFMYRYDWMVTPYVNDESMKKDKLLKGFSGCLQLLDNFKVKKKILI